MCYYCIPVEICMEDESEESLSEKFIVLFFLVFRRRIAVDSLECVFSVPYRRVMINDSMIFSLERDWSIVNWWSLVVLLGGALVLDPRRLLEVVVPSSCMILQQEDKEKPSASRE